jgi:hypothetical protein
MKGRENVRSDYLRNVGRSHIYDQDTEVFFNVQKLLVADVEAEEDSAFSLTLSWRSQEAEFYQSDWRK